MHRHPTASSSATTITRKIPTCTFATVFAIDVINYGKFAAWLKMKRKSTIERNEL